MTKLVEELKGMMEQYGATPGELPALSYDEKKKLVREMVKSPAVKKLASELAKILVTKYPKDATPRERETCASDMASMLAYEIGAMAAFESMTEEKTEIATIRTKSPKMIEAFDASFRRLLWEGQGVLPGTVSPVSGTALEPVADELQRLLKPVSASARASNNHIGGDNIGEVDSGAFEYSVSFAKPDSKGTIGVQVEVGRPHGDYEKELTVTADDIMKTPKKVAAAIAKVLPSELP